MTDDVFVIGAGPAGLTAGYLLTKAGVGTTVIEADPRYVGGISRTENYKGYLFDIGGHRFFSVSRPAGLHHQPLAGRVGDWRAGLGRSLCSPLTRSFVCECHIISTMPRFQPPPRRTQRAIF